MLQNLLIGLTNVLDVNLLLLLILGVTGGIAIGALPGLTSTMGVALLLPVTFGMDATVAISMLIGIYCGAIYGGSISAILLKTPGTPASAATMFDGYPMAMRGEGGRAVGISTTSSAIGGMISGIALMTVAPILARFALKFGPAEFFALAFFGLTIIVSISGKSVVKGISAGLIGLLVSTVGIDAVTGIPRFTFDQLNLQQGFQLIPVMIGLFAGSEIILQLETRILRPKLKAAAKRILPTKADFLKLLPTTVRSALMGIFIGAVPGTGGDIAAYVSYNVAQRVSKNPEKFGTGAVEGIAASEAANNGTTGGTLIPLLTLGVPGDSTTAVLLGALMLQGLKPGPMLFIEHTDVVYTIFVSFMLANVFLLIIGLGMMRFYIKILSAPAYLITATIFVLCTVGSFAISNNFFDVIVMFIFSFVGYFLLKLQVPLSPIVLAVILGPLAETNLRRALMLSDGSLNIFFQSPISFTLILVGVLALLSPVLRSIFRKNKVTEDVK